MNAVVEARTGQKNKALVYMVAGFSFGLLFPVTALSIDIFFMHELPLELDSILYAHIENPLNYIVDLSPLVLGVFSYFLGRNAEKIAFYSRHLEDLVDERTADLRAANAEQEAILTAVDEGLFLLTQEDGVAIVSGKQSRSTEQILGAGDLGGQSFLQVMRSRLAEGDAAALADYLDLIFLPDTHESVLNDLNPVEQVRVTVEPPEGPPVFRHLEFRFKPVSGGPTAFLVYVRDVSPQVELAEEMARKDEKAKSQVGMLLSILHVGANLLDDFLEGVEDELAVMEATMQSEQSTHSPAEALETVMRSAHSIKGNATLLDFGFLAEQAHQLEEKAVELREKKTLAWQDFIPLAYGLSEIQKLYGELKDLLVRIEGFQSARRGRDTSSIDLIPEAVSGLLERLSQEQGIEAQLEDSGFDTSSIPGRYAYILRDILVQMVRNSIMHGIEKPDVRESLGKPPMGQIKIAARGDGDNFVVTYRDDGAGFKLDKIRERLIASEQATPEEAAGWDSNKLISLIFKPGFSTARETTLHSGRGMGMDIIRQRVRSAEGELRVHHSPGKFVQFTVSLPAAASA